MNKNRPVIIVLVLIILLIVSDIIYINISKKHTANQAVKVYSEFIEGRRSYKNENILTYATPTREPEKRYATYYFIADSTGDGIPELHLHTPREYVIFTYKDNNMDQLRAFFSRPWKYHLLQNGVIVNQEYLGDLEIIGGTHYDFFTLDLSGDYASRLSFGWRDINDNYSFDDEDEYYFADSDCTMDEWLEQTKEYIYLDEEGRECIRNEVEWIKYCDER